jgi:hypothetical protein
MNKVARKLVFISIFLLAALIWPQEPSEELQVLKPGERFTVSEGITGEWEFSQKPQIGMVILKIQLFDKNDVKISSLSITGDSGMPSMPGSHDTGDVAFKLNKAKNYLLPVNVVMPGDWAVKLIFSEGDAILLRAVIRFDV